MDICDNILLILILYCNSFVINICILVVLEYFFMVIGIENLVMNIGNVLSLLGNTKLSSD